MRVLRLPWRAASAAHQLFDLFVICSILLAPAAAYAASVSGRVVDPDGRAVPGARLLVTTAVGHIVERAADAQGAFTIADLPAGHYVVRAIADGLQADPVALSLAEDDAHEMTLAMHVSAVTESIVVSASQIDLPLSRTADAVSVITRDDLAARQTETVADALRTIPGIGVVRSGGRGAITSIFPRGGASNYTLVLVDGVRANGFGGDFDFGHLSVADVDRIEVVRGPESALFGSDAIGAVVQIVTRRGGRPHADALVEGGSQATARALFGASGSTGNWSWGAGAEQSRSDGFTGIAPATGERVSNDDDHLAHASGTLGWQRPGGVDVAATGRLDRSERGFPGAFGANPIGAYTAVDRVSRGIDNTRQVGVRLSHPWSSSVRQRVDANYTNLSSDFVSPFGPSNSGSARLVGRVQEDAVFGTMVGASAGVELERERGFSSFITGAAGERLPIRRSTVGTFAEARLVARERLFVTAGVRVERLTRDGVEPSVDPFSPRPAFPPQTLDSINPKIAASYVVAGDGNGATTRVRASAGTGIRPPNAFEVAFTNNPNLKPERSRSADAGIEQEWGHGALALSATVFVNRYDDLIVAVGRALLDASHFTTDNISNARARGAELDLRGRVRGGFTVHGAYTFLSTELLAVDGIAGTAPAPFTVRDPLIRRPRHQGSVDVSYTRGRLSSYAEVTGRARLLDVEPNYGATGGLFFTPGYVVLNAGASVRLTGGFDAYARVLNAADRAYEETLGFPALGRSLVAGVRFAAGR